MARTALDFYEDEDPNELLAIFDARENGVTTCPTSALPHMLLSPTATETS
ncbi:hypothetical protein [Nonomuraea sp. PA05]|nr:hypothetical protein [Nonomuraea sp. PA05]